MKTINLKDFYYWYTQDEFIEVSDEVADELFAGKRFDKAYERNMYRHKAHYSLDLDDGIEASSIVCYNDSPERVLDMMERHCDLCRALNSLPEIQGRRIEAYYILGKSINDIAKAEGVTKGSVSISITRGLAAMKKYLRKSDGGVKLYPENCQGI